MDCFDKQTLEAHNYYRRLHGVPPLTWNSGLARDAQAWAEVLAHEGRLKRADTRDGENIFMLLGQEITGSEAVDRWYHEQHNYNYSTPGFQSNTMHFTQVVWKSTKDFGVGKAQSADGKIFVVGRYRPAGNNMKTYQDNVFSYKKGSLPQRQGAKSLERWDPVINDRHHVTKREPIELHFNREDPPLHSSNGHATSKTNEALAKRADMRNGNNLYRDRWESNRKSKEIYENLEGSAVENNTARQGKPGARGTRESIKRWEQASVNGEDPERFAPTERQKKSQKETRSGYKESELTRKELALSRQTTIEDKIKKFDNEYKPKSRPQRPVSEPDINYVHADAQHAQSSSYTERTRAPRPKSATGLQQWEKQLAADSRKILTTFEDGPRKTVVSSITVTLKGNEGPARRSKSVPSHSSKDSPGSRPSADAVPVMDEASQSCVLELICPFECAPESLTPSEDAVLVMDEVIRPSVAKTKPLVIDFQEDIFQEESKDDTPTCYFYEDEVDSDVRSGPSSVDTTSLEEFQQQALQAHNYFRAFHGAKALKWSHDLARSAQAWADKLARERVLKHFNTSEIGENLAMFSGKFSTAGEEAVNLWYEESECYDFRRPGYQSNTSHFTQLVWKDTREFGVGRAQTSDGRFTFVVGRYRPAGNVLRKFEDNVFPQQF